MSRIASRKAKPGAQRQEIGRQAGEIDEGRVEQRKLALLVEDREADGQMGKGLGQRLHEFAQALLGLNGGIGRQGEEQPTLAFGKAEQVEPTPGFGFLEPLALACRALSGGGALEETGQGPGQVFAGLEIAGGLGEIGGIGPDHRAFGILAPHEQRGLSHGAAQLVQLLRQGALCHKVEPRGDRAALVVEGNADEAAAQFGLQDQRIVGGAARGHHQTALRRELGHPFLEAGEARAEIGDELGPWPTPRRAEGEQGARAGGGVDQLFAIEEEGSAAGRVGEDRVALLHRAGLQDRHQHDARRGGKGGDQDEF